VTSVLDRLEQAGLVQRERSDEDRRVVLVRLAPGAEARIARTMASLHQELAGMFDGWDTMRIESLVKQLDDLGVSS
jgi:DNA-binding MarR family transcriptional regulator